MGPRAEATVLRRGFRGSGARWRGFPLRARTSRGATAYACASMLGRQAILEAATSYLRSHPEELGRVLRNALGLRFGVPIAGLRWLAGQGGSGPQDVEIDADPPGIRLAATLDMMGVPVRATTSIFIERIRASAEELKLELRLEGTRLQVLDETAESPVAALIRSGALDLTKSGSLAANMPKVGKLLGDSTGNRLVIDLMKHPKIGQNKVVRRALGLVSSIVTVHGVESDEGHVDVLLRAFPQGITGAARAVRDHLLGDGPPWFRGMLPGRRADAPRPGY